MLTLAPTTAPLPRVHQLPDQVANVIAAGEVVERPASVVKELVENALDAGATDITVVLDDAGKTRIEIRDNGCGLHADDLPLALQRHATSKIQSIDDLQQIASLGFRGEALPSIAAAAAQFTMMTRDATASQGAQLSMFAGGQQTVQPVAMPIGTIVRVEQLFDNLPARRKFLKSDRTELAHCTDYLFRLALAAWHTRFRVEHQQRIILRAESTNSPTTRLTELFGGDLARALLPIDEAGGPIALAGWCSPPGLATAPHTGLYLYVNGRMVRDRLLLHAVGEGYRTYLPAGVSPLVFLQLRMPHDLVDVNVHPAKAEVRFANPQGVHQLIVHTLRKILGTVNTLRGDTATNLRLPTLPATANPTPPMVREQTPIAWRTPSSSANPVGCTTIAPTPLTTDAPPAQLSGARYLGQLSKTYLLFDLPERGLLLIDQHAAHERIGYVRLSADAGKTTSIQTLLAPLIIDLPPLHHARLLEQLALLHACGLAVEDFGGTSLAITAVPSLLAHSDLSQLLHAIADDLLHVGASERAGALQERVLMTMACHRQIRAGTPLTADEAYALLDQLQIDPGLDRCPHGRPTWLRLGLHEIERRFGRS